MNLKLIFKSRIGTYIGLFLIVGIHVCIWANTIIGPFNLTLLVFSVLFEIFFVASFVILVIKYESIKYQVVRDSMTQIFNWKYMQQTIESEIAKSARLGTDFAIMNFDIDDSKLVNDEYGHYTGDKSLISVVEAVKSIIRPYDVFGRTGGEEFCIVFTNTGEVEAKAVSERIRTGIENLRINRKIPITISSGVTLCREDDDYNSLYKRVDDAMYRAKDRGKNRVVFD